MAKADAKAEPAPPAKGGKMGWLVMGVIGLVAAAGGFFVPQFFGGAAGNKDSAEAHESKMPSGPKLAFVPFGEVVVNLNEERLTRYVRVKVVLAVDLAQEKPFTELLQRHKFTLRSWLIGYLADKSLQEVSGAPGINRLRREIQDEFNNRLFPDGSEKIREVLFEEFVVQ